MNPVSLDAIKLLMDLQTLITDEAYKAKLARMVEQLVFIMEKDIEQAFQKYSSVKLV